MRPEPFKVQGSPAPYVVHWRNADLRTWITEQRTIDVFRNALCVGFLKGVREMPECHVNKNKARCTCTYEPCERKGNCCECISYHWKMKQLPGCLFSPEGERTYDRSIRRFIAENK